MIRLIIILLAILVFAFCIIRGIIIMKKNSLEGKPLMDGLGEQKNVNNSNSIFSDDTDLSNRHFEHDPAVLNNNILEKVGAVSTNISGLNSHWRIK